MEDPSRKGSRGVNSQQEGDKKTEPEGMEDPGRGWTPVWAH